MDKRNKSTLPGLIISKNSTSSLEGIKNAKGSRGSSALPIMKYFGSVKPSRDEKIIKPDMTSNGKVTKQDLPIIREVLQPGFSSNFRTNYTLPSTFDANAAAYFTAAGITDTTEKDAVNQLVLDLKGEGSTTNNSNVWSSLDVIHPISPTSLAAATYNIKDPNTHNITWFNSPTHSVNGVNFSGSSVYGDTNYNPTLDGGLQDNHVMGLSMFDTLLTELCIPMGSRSSTPNLYNSFVQYSGSIYYQLNAPTPSADFTGTLGAANYSIVRSSATSMAFYKNGSLLHSKVSSSTGIVNLNYFYGGVNLNGSISNPRSFTLEFGYIGLGLTPNQVKDLSIAIYKYRYFTLKGIENVEIEAVEYAMSAQIKDVSELVAINNLVKDLKGTGSTTNNTNVWDSMYAVYPLSPTSLSASTFNLKDTTKNITWFNSPTHATTGITGNGSTMYGNTSYNPITEGWSESNVGLTYSGEFSSEDYPIGSRIGTPIFAIRNILIGGIKASLILSQAPNAAQSSSTARDITTASRTSTTSNKIFTNGVEIDEFVTPETNIMPNGDIFILGLNLNNSLFAAFAKEIDFAAMHTGLTNNQAKDLADAITNYNTAVR